VEVYTLDNLFRRDKVVDKFESLIWTERFKNIGDFELHIHSTPENRNLFPAGTRIATNESHRVMTVETVEGSTDDEGRKMLTLRGRSLEQILEDRVARNTTANLTTTPKWVLTGLPVAIAKQIFHDTCVLGMFSTSDIIPNINEGPGLYPADTIAAPTDSITVEIEPMSVYSAIKQLSDLYGFGFRLIRNYDTSMLYFDVYMGSDRTTGQSTLPAVIFSPDLDNLKNSRELTTIATYKNVAYVMSPVGTAVVYSDDVDPTTVTGHNRRVLWVKADDITDPNPATLTDRLNRRGREELSKYRRLSAFDGEIGQITTYKYGVDINLGDLIEVRNVDGATNNMQVTEWINVQDGEGQRSYPTLSLNTFITPGSWLAWDYNQTWFDLASDPMTWSTA
jgi:Siphovirus ReqiPepy6 Gp37-like protein